MRKSSDLPGPKAEPNGFYELAKAHVAAHGGEWFVVEAQGPTRQQWRAWLAYFAWLDGLTVPRGRKAATFQTLAKITVPAAWPLQFDASAPPSPLPELPESPVTPARRRELAAMLQGTVADLELRQMRAPTWRDMTAAQAEDRLGKLAAEYVATPPTIGPALAKRAPPQIGGGEGSDQSVRDGFAARGIL